MVFSQRDTGGVQKLVGRNRQWAGLKAIGSWRGGGIAGNARMKEMVGGIGSKERIKPIGGDERANGRMEAMNGCIGDSLEDGGNG